MPTLSPIHALEARRDFLDRCARCSQCKFVPSPQSQRHASACPSIDHGQYHSYSAGGQVIMAAALLEGHVEPTAAMLDAVSACTMCGACDVSCKVNFAEIVEPLDSLYALRARLAEQGQSPTAWREQMAAVRAHGNAQGRPRAERARWTEGLPLRRSGERADVLLHVGSTLAYDHSRHATLRTVVSALLDNGITATHLGSDEGSSGSLAFDLGFQADAHALAQQMTERVRQSGATTLVTFSAPALSAFRAVYPRFGLSFGPVRVLHITEYLQERHAAGQLRLHSVADAPPSVAYHDACKLGRLSEPWQRQDVGLDHPMTGFYTARAPETLRFGHGGVYEAPRALLRAMGLDVVELERHHEASYCCGACGGVQQAQPEAASGAARNRLAELDGAGTPVFESTPEVRALPVPDPQGGARKLGAAQRVLVSGCTGCSRHLGEHAPAHTQVLDLLDLLARSLQPAATTA